MKQNQLLNIALGLALAFGSTVPTRAQDLLQYLDLNSDEFTKSDMTRAEIEAAIAAAGAGVVDLFGKRLNGLDLSGLDLRKSILKAAYITGRTSPAPISTAPSSIGPGLSGPTLRKRPSGVRACLRLR